ncbi:hypothetical protein D3C81_1582330 [compost metagenome]
MEYGDPGHDEGKNHAFDDAVEHIVDKGHAVLHVRPVGTVIDPQPVDGHPGTAPDTHHAENHRQHRQGNEAGPQARGNDVLERVHPDHFQAGELFGGLHVADFRRQRRTGTPGEQQSGDHRPQLAQQRQRNHLPHRLLRTVAGEDVEALERQHHADEYPGDHDDHQGHYPHRMQLLDQQAKPATDTAAPQQCMKQENRGAPEHRQHIDARVAEPAHPFQQ